MNEIAIGIFVIVAYVIGYLLPVLSLYIFMRYRDGKRSGR